MSKSHTTPLGGVVSIFLETMMAVYVVSLFIIMLQYEDDKTFKHQYSIAVSEDG